MKTKMLIVALLAGVSLIAPARAGNHHGGSGNSSVGTRSSPARGGSFYRSGQMGHYGSRTYQSGQSFSSIHTGAPSSMRSNGTRFARSENNFTRNNGATHNQTAGTGQTRNGNRLVPNWRNHVVAKQSASSHPNWDRRRDHFFRGRRFVFIDGFWWGFDFGFDPWWPWWYPYNYGYYPYGYYPYGYNYPYGYSYGYDQGYGYNNGAYDPGTYNDENQQYNYRDQTYNNRSANTTVAAVQDRLSRDGYYRGEIDGVLGPATRRAIVRFQNRRGLRANGELTAETLNALGLRGYANY